MFNDLTSPASYLSSRRSGRPRDMVAPGPSDNQWHNILEMALRTPDHGKLAPWRFVKILHSQREDFAKILSKAFLKTNPDCNEPQITAATASAHMAPCLTLLIYSPKDSIKIPKQEQILSAGAVGMNMLHAAHAHGFVGSWITGWAAYDENIRREFCDINEKIIGFFYIGLPSIPLIERTRPNSKNHISTWKTSNTSGTIAS